MAKELRERLVVKNVSLRFGGLQALDDVSISIREGEILGIIGPNGAGKTCLLNCINHFYHPQEGDIYFDGRRITKWLPDKIARLGIARTFQGTQLYAGMSVQDNIMAGRHPHFKSGLLSCAFYFGPAHDEEIKHREVIEEIIDFLEVDPVRKHLVGSLGYGLRKRIDLGRALALEPEVLLMDEPMAGMNRDEKEDMARFVLDIFEERGITCITIIEHDMGLIMDICDRIIVFDFGHKIAEGSPEEIRVNEQVIKAYLGVAK